MNLLPREEILLLLETILFLGNFIIGLILLLFFSFFLQLELELLNPLEGDSSRISSS